MLKLEGFYGILIVSCGRNQVEITVGNGRRHIKSCFCLVIARQEKQCQGAMFQYPLLLYLSNQNILLLRLLDVVLTELGVGLAVLFIIYYSYSRYRFV